MAGAAAAEDSKEYDLKRWLNMFETMCGRYRCRAIEDIRPDDSDLYLCGPGGKWLAEIASVEFDCTGALIPSSRDALQKLAQAVMLTSRSIWDNRGEEIVIAIDWFLNCQRDRYNERRQCFVRICQNDRMLTVLLLSNTVTYGELSPNSLAFSRHSDRLRPFIFILACELFYRRIDFEILNLHYEPLTTSSRWRKRQLSTCAITAANNDRQCFESDGAGDGWLELSREMHSRSRFLRVLHTRRAHEILDAMITVRSTCGRIRYMWRNGRSMRTYGVNPIARGTLINLRDLDLEIAALRSCVLALCDFSVFHSRCNYFMLFHKNASRLRLLENGGFVLVDEEDNCYSGCSERDELPCSDSWARQTLSKVRSTKRRLESPYEQRAFVDASGNLCHSHFLSFS